METMATIQERLSFYGAESPSTAERMQAFDDYAGELGS
jgi:hypothetical protein